MCLFGQAFVGWGLSSFVRCDGSQHYQLPSLLRDSLHRQDTTPHRRDQHHLKHRSNHASNKHTHLNKR